MSSARTADIRKALRVEGLSIAWMGVELVVGVLAAAAAGSVALVAFGLDSGIEILSAAVLLWRLRVEAQGAGSASIDAAERRAQAITGGLLILLGAYVITSSGVSLIQGKAPQESVPGLLLAVAAIVIMPLLIRQKRDIAGRIGSAALRADASCGTACLYMALVLLAGLALNALFGWWWADPAAALGIVYFVLREGLEATRAAFSRSGEGRA